MLLKQFKSGLLAVLVVCLLGLAAQAQGIVITMGPMGDDVSRRSSHR